MYLYCFHFPPPADSNKRPTGTKRQKHSYILCPHSFCRPRNICLTSQQYWNKASSKSFTTNLFPLLSFFWQMNRGLRISDPCSRKREQAVREKNVVFFCEKKKTHANPWQALIFSASVGWSRPEKNNSLQKKRVKLILNSGSCFSVLQGRTMKESVSTSVSQTFAGCWRDSSRCKRRGRRSKQRYSAAKDLHWHLWCARGWGSPSKHTQFPLDHGINPENYVIFKDP